MNLILALSLLFSVSPSTRLLDSLIEAAARPRGGTTSAYAVRWKDSSVVWEHDSWRRMLPASTLKILSASALRRILGDTSTLATRLVRTGNLADSVLEGDLVLEGHGDPTFARGDDSGALETAIGHLKSEGWREIHGDLVVRDALMRPADLPWPGSWDFDNSLGDCDGGAPIGISVNGNCPNDSSQAPPARRIGADLSRMLDRSGIRLHGGVRFENVPGQAPGTLLREWRSKPLDSLLREALWKSSNHDMETLGLLAGSADTASARRSGLDLVRRDLASRGFDTLANTLADQSGLSRKNALTTASLAQQIRRDARDPRTNILPFLPGPGEGTLKVRMARTLPGKATLRAKTGSLDGVSAIAGMLVPPDGDTLSFAIFFQGHSGSAKPIRFAQDQMLGVLAGGPVVAPVVADTLPPAPRPWRPLPRRPALLDP